MNPSQNSGAGTPLSKNKSLRYGNFADPFGLVWRMLREGGRIGRSALAMELLSKFAMPLDWMMQGKERKLLDTESHADLPLVFVIGPPRSGTTLVYQVLARHLNVSYFTNRNALFPKSPLTAAQRWEKSAIPPAGNYNSLYGNTSGLAGPNDGFHVWNRFLGDDRYEADSSFSNEAQEALRTFFGVWTATLWKPLLNKNNRNTACFAELADALPTSRYVVVRRDPRFVTQSLIKARKWVQGSKKLGWGLLSSSVEVGKGPHAYVDSVCEQVKFHLQILKQQRERINPERIIEVDYEQFCHDPREATSMIVKRLPGVELRAEAPLEELSPFQVSQAWTLPQESIERIEESFADGSHKTLRGPMQPGRVAGAATQPTREYPQ